eukprot:TRINITY_DN28687_c0_g1_i1.p1 TRINITY_DN28687_c0_g1~~TRINITY_DN28687_c0_g1_i1.p1  ORF type:complete len:252 (-),score=74.77 TRINITY_DN28687_c0_g1_i1:118-873(-)
MEDLAAPNAPLDSAGTDDEWEESEFLVLLEIDGSDPIPANCQYSLVGVDTPTPYLTLNDKVFRGRHDEVMGTSMFFEEHRQPIDASEPNGPTEIADLSLFGTTTKKIKFERVTLEPKAPPAAAPPAPAAEDESPAKRPRGLRKPAERLLVKKRRSTKAQAEARREELAQAGGKEEQESAASQPVPTPPEQSAEPAAPPSASSPSASEATPSAGETWSDEDDMDDEEEDDEEEEELDDADDDDKEPDESVSD